MNVPDILQEDRGGSGVCVNGVGRGQKKGPHKGLDKEKQFFGGGGGVVKWRRSMHWVAHLTLDSCSLESSTAHFGLRC